ncbi:DUF1631 family protein [Lysobacter sp. N42]|uniref:DUF1631 family protein n=1 Tax=Lysobacter sp. N42 TaxID=2545719 RepID=UPI00104FB2B4|nr:DUF1631 family protein [Lysobacter sp. N42]TCZ83408.1 DUF1631 family protein [Lysobacter sp. N42]
MNPRALDPQNPRLDPARVLEEVKRLSVEQLGAFPTALYAPIEHDLREAGPEVYPEQAGLAVLRTRAASDTMRFRAQIAQGFEEFRNPHARAGVPLGLIDEDLIDLHLAAQRLTEILEQRYETQLAALRSQFEAMATALRIAPGANPLFPARLCTVFIETLANAGLSPTLGMLLFRHYQQQLVRVLDELYPRLVSLLASAGYVPGGDVPLAQQALLGEQVEHRAVPFDTVEPLEPAAAQPEAAPWTPAGLSAGLAPLAPAGRRVERFSEELAPLRQQLHAWRQEARASRQARAGMPRAPGLPGMPGAPVSGWTGAMAPAGYGGAVGAGAMGAGMAGGYAGFASAMGGAPMRQFHSRELVGIASMLQAEPPDHFARALASTGRLGDAIRDYLAEGARRMGLHPELTGLSEEDEDAIDMVALLFESLFRTHALAERARRVYARLVLPYVKVALNDDSMFVERMHPARRLLDAMTEACEDNTGSTPQDRELLERAAAVSQRIVAEFNEDLAVFETAHAELEELLAQQRRRVELQEQRAAKASFGRERLAQARAAADVVLQRRLTAAPLTQAIGDFLATPWRHHLVQTLLREGEESPRYREAVAMGDALAHADALAARGEGDALVRQLLALEAPLTECLASSGLDATAAGHGLAGIVRGLADPDAPRRIRPMPPAVRDEPEQETRLWLAGGTDTLRHDPQVAATIRQLDVGAWLRLTDAQGETVSVKLAWVSPLTSRRLLVNRRGMRVLVASVEELAVLAADGRLVIDTGRSPFDAAMRQLQDQLELAVGHG